MSTLLILILLFSFISCQKTRVQNLQERLDSFRQTLPESLRAEFDAQKYDIVVRGIDSLLLIDEEFKTGYEQMKDRELINVFTPQEVVDFFKVYFVEEIEKEKTKSK
ncbi:MAG: hypothetical protein OEV55_03355 [candidate division Zixibacteria bacterium]|nr:hypothetical protein [candidate division Zixibacteria bacterium]